MKKEVWKPLRRYETLLHISNYGNVKMLRREVPSGTGIRTVPERILTPYVSKDKYKYGMVSFRAYNNSRTIVIGRAVYETFNDLDLDVKKVVVHKDGNRLNNRIENIKIITRRTIKQIRANKTGVVGVTKLDTCYSANIVFEGRRLILHTSKNKSECHKIYQLAKSMIDEYDKLKIGILNNSRLNNKLLEKQIKLIQ